MSLLHHGFAHEEVRVHLTNTLILHHNLHIIYYIVVFSVIINIELNLAQPINSVKKNNDRYNEL